MIFSAKPSRRECILGGIYLLIDLFVLPPLLNLGNAFLGSPFSTGKLNFLYFLLNFAAVLPIFRRYLLQSVRDSVRMVFPVVWYALLGYLGYQFLGEILLRLLLSLYPRFANLNDLSIAAAVREDFAAMAIGTILLVPVTEETLFRGMLFRGLYDRSPAAAYLLSMAAFSAVHVIGYVGLGEPVLLALSFVQYLPAGYCLCFAYRRSGTIVSPILMHMLVNAAAVFSMR